MSWLDRFRRQDSAGPSPVESRGAPVGQPGASGEAGGALTPALSHGERGADLVDPRVLMHIRSLELRARVVVEGFTSGLHRSPFHGFSVEFTEYRQYTPGDDLRYLDWRLLARSDRSYVKRFEDETNLRCHLLVDGSRSMSYGSLGYTKAQYAATLAATLAYFLATQRDAVGLAMFDSKVSTFIPARYRPGQLRRLFAALEQPPVGRDTNLAGPLEQAAELVRKRGLLVLISDLLAPLDRLEASLGALRAMGHEVLVFQTLDPAELDFGFDAPAEFEDAETGRRWYIDPVTVREGYQQKLAAHLKAVETACAHLGIDYRRLRTDEPLERALVDVLDARQRGGQTRQARRRTAGGLR